MVRGILRAATRIVPFPPLPRLAGSRVVAPMYHLVANHAPPHIKHLYPIVGERAFRQSVELMLKHFAPVSIRQAISLLENRQQEKYSKPPLLITFDDGFREVAEVAAPILSQMGVPSALFVSPNFVGNNDMMYRCKLSLILTVVERNQNLRPPGVALEHWGKEQMSRKQFCRALMSLEHSNTGVIDAIASELGVDWQGYLKENKPYLGKDELISLSKQGFCIGAHSMSHPYMDKLNEDEQIGEATSSLEWVQQNIPNQPKAFAFPFTTHGVSPLLYSRLLDGAAPKADIMLGTAGLYATRHPKLLHRIPMEENKASARSILGAELIYFAAKRALGIKEG